MPPLVSHSPWLVQRFCGVSAWHPFCSLSAQSASRSAHETRGANVTGARHGTGPGEILTRGWQRLEARQRLASITLRTQDELAGRMHSKEEHMRETGILSIVRCGSTIQVGYASLNPYDMDRCTYQCPNESALVAMLHNWGIDAWSLQQALVSLRKGKVAVLPVALSEALLQTYFPLQHPTHSGMDADDSGAQAAQRQGAAAVRGVGRPRAWASP
jgi:hypothetical protein